MLERSGLILPDSPRRRSPPRWPVVLLALNAFNEELLIRLQESGVAAPSNTRLNRRYAIRVANTNHRSRREDFDLLVQTVVQLGDALAAERR